MLVFVDLRSRLSKYLARPAQLHPQTGMHQDPQGAVMHLVQFTLA